MLYANQRLIKEACGQTAAQHSASAEWSYAHGNLNTADGEGGNQSTEYGLGSSACTVNFVRTLRNCSSLISAGGY